MTRYVSFLRAINVGGRRVTMDKLRVEFEALGFDDVSTYIASGNVLFTTTGKPDALEQRIEAQLAKALSFEVVTFVRTAAEVAKAAAHDPFPDRHDGDSHYVAFLKKGPTAAATKAIEALSGAVDTLVVDGKDLHWLVRGKFLDSELKPKALERAAAGDPGTTRNTTMLRKLAAKLDG